MHREKRLSSETSSATIIDGNDDLLTEILVLLPAKSLIRFQLVSKHWRSLISDKSFPDLHQRHSRRRQPQLSFILRTTGSQQFFICDLTAKTMVRLHFEWSHVKILQSSNGLLLLECRKSPRARKEIYVYNPTTMQRTELLKNLRGEDTCRFCLMYDPSKSLHYRVFHFKSYRYNNSTTFEVYDSRSLKWEGGSGRFDQTLQRFPDGVVLNDRLYFIRVEAASWCFSPEDDHHQIFSTVTKPPRIRHSDRRKRYMMESNGHLHCLVLSFVRMDECCFLDVYEVIDGKTWLRVDMKAINIAAKSIEEIEVLGFVRREREDDSTVVYHVPGKIMSYRFGDEVSEEIVDFSELSYCQKGSLQFQFKDSFRFIHSLAPLHV